MPKDETTYTPRPPRDRSGPTATGPDGPGGTLSPGTPDTSIIGAPGDMTLIVVSPETLDAVLDKAQALEAARLRSLSGQVRRRRTRDEFGGEDTGGDIGTADEFSPTANGNCPRCSNSFIC